MRPAVHQPVSSLDRYARSLRFELGQKDLSRLKELPTAELVLLLSAPDGSSKRVVVRCEDGAISVSDQASNRFVPQAVVECLLAHWVEYVRTGAVTDLDHFDVFGNLDVLERFLRIQRLEQRPVALRCHNMVSARASGSRASRPATERATT